MNHIYILCSKENDKWFNYYDSIVKTYESKTPISVIEPSNNIIETYLNLFDYVLTHSDINTNDYYAVFDTGVLLAENIWNLLNNTHTLIKESTHCDLAHLSLESSYDTDALCYSHPMQSMIISRNAVEKMYNYLKKQNVVERFDIVWSNALNELNIQYCELGHAGICKNTNVFFTENINLLRVYDFPQKMRLGEKADGGYVIGDLSGSYDCYISAGVGENESFSEDFLKRYVLNSEDSFAFDGTVSEFPTNYECNIQFIKKNIGASNDDLLTNLAEHIDKYNNIFLKMDIESGEFPWLMWISLEQLQKFKQIVIELHSITSDHEYNNSTKMACLRKLCETHYLIHAHGNNGCFEFGGIPAVIELTFVRKTEFNSVPEWNTNPLPIPDLDYPNCNHNAEIILNHFPFVQFKRK